MKNGNVIKLNLLHLNSCHFNGTEKVQKGSAGGGSIVIPPPPVEPPVEPTPTYTLSASVTNGKVSAKRNGSAVNLPFTANEGDVIVVSVTPNDGYAFEGWADGNTDNPRSITMNADKVLSAECSEVVQPPVGNYIQFEDAEVERVLMSKGVSSDGVGITIEDAEKVTSIGTWFRDNGLIKSFLELSLFSNLKKIGGDTLGYSAFYSCDQLQSLGFPENAESIGAYCLYQCNNLSIDISRLPQSIKSLGMFAFQGVTTTGVLDLPNLEGTINWGNFNDVAAKQLEGIENLGAITSIAGFMKQEKLRYVNIPQTCIDIAQNAFSGCSALEQVICRATTPPTLGTTVFSGSTCPIYVPDASLEAYKGATNWNQYADRIHPLSEIEGSLVFYDKLVGDGTAYINTKYYAKGTDSFAWDAEKPTSWNQFIFGTKSSALNLGVLPININQTYYLVGSAGADSAHENNGGRVARALQVLAIDGSLHRVLTDNGVQTKDFGVVGSYADKTSSAPLLLFACQLNATNATADRIYNGAIRSFSITDIDGNTIMSLKPCTWNGEAGMWDEVGNKFYGNAAARGEFSAAND